MKEIRYVITDELGIHARPAGLLVRVTGKFDCNIKIQKGTMNIDAKSILGIMSLCAKNGEEIVITCEGTDEAEASESIRAFCKDNL